jgi:hypothetical protein
MTTDPATDRARLAEFARQWRIKRDADPSGLIYSIHFDAAADPADLLVQDIESVVAALARVEALCDAARRNGHYLTAAEVLYATTEEGA